MSALDRVLGRKLNETTTTGDIAPVMANVPTWQHIKRKKDAEGRKKKSSEVAKVVGEAQEEEEVIPADAEGAEEGDFNASQGVYVSKPKEQPKAPEQPTSDEEKLLTPAAALVAPDVTPDSMTEIDPSKVPGRSGGQSFRASDLNAPPQQPGAQPGERTDPGVSQMDILLGRQRSNTANGPGSPPPTQPIMTEDSAAALFSTASGEDLLRPGIEVPPPTQGRVDAKAVCEAARKFI